MHILIIEDNPDIVANLYGFLEPLGYTLDVAYSGSAGIASAVNAAHDVIVLDLSLPRMDGLEVCQRLRKEHRISTPILMLTARDTELDKLTGFSAGADDYLVKPFSMRELDARLQALLRRSRNQVVDRILEVGELRLDTGTGQAWRRGHLLSLTPTGYKILAALMRNAPMLITREELEREIWGDCPPDSDALRTHIHALRQVLDKPFESPLLVTMPGKGYRMMVSNER